MKTFYRVLTVLLAVLGSAQAAWGEDLILASDSLEDNLYRVIVPEEFQHNYRQGDLFDLYERREEVAGNMVLVNPVDSVVLVSIEKQTLVFSPLWDGALKMIQGEFILSSTGRNIETETPDLSGLNEEVARSASSRPSMAFLLDLLLITDFTGFGGDIYLGFRFNRNQVGLGVDVLAGDLLPNGMGMQYFLDYRYNLPLGERFEMQLGGGIALRLLETSGFYESEIVNMIGLRAETALAFLITGNIDLRITASYSGYLAKSGGMDSLFNVGAGIGFAF